MSTYYKECYVEKLYHFDGIENWEKLKIGERLSLVVMNEEPFKDQVKVKDKSGCKVFGVISKDDGKLIYDIISSGWNETFSAKVVNKDENGDEDKKIKIVISIEKKKNNRGIKKEKNWASQCVKN